MIPVSAAFATAIKATVRRIKAKAQIVWTSSTIDPTITVSSNDDNYVHHDWQGADENSLASRKWAHLDGVIKPTGAYYPMPDETQALVAQMGWWGATRCNGSSIWSGTYPTLTVTFTERPILSLLVAGDQIYNEYPVDFDIKVYSTGDVLELTEAVTGNTSLIWSKAITTITDVIKMELILKKWSAPNRVAKILEFYTSITEEYTGDDIVSMNLLEERELEDGSLPIGNISCNELDIELQNIKLVKNGTTIRDPFAYENSLSEYDNVLKPNRKITASLGVVLEDDSVEYVKLGTFWSGDWKASEKSATVTTSAWDRMKLLDKAEFSESLIYTNTTLYDLMEIILNHAKANVSLMSDLAWSIDAELDSADYSIPVAYFPRQSYFKCIRQIVEACMGQAYMSRDDVLIVTGPSFAGNSTAGYAIIKDDYFDKTQPSKSEQLKNFVSVPISKLTQQTENSEVYTSEYIVLAVGAEHTIITEYNNATVSSASGALSDDSSAGMAITEETYYVWGCVVTVKNNGAGSGTFRLIVSGIIFDLKSDEVVEDSDAASILEFGTLKYEFKPNHLLQKRDTGETMAANLLASYKDFRKDVQLQWRGDPSLELGDLVEVPEYQRGAIDKRANFLIFKNELSFDGALRATTEARKISDA